MPRFPSATYWTDCLFSIVYSCLLCCILIDHRCGGLFLGSLICSIDLCLFLCQYHAVLITVGLQNSLKSRRMISPALFFFIKIALAGTSLAVQWLRLCASTAGGMGSIPGQGSKILHTKWHGQKKKRKRKKKEKKDFFGNLESFVVPFQF